MNEPMPFDSQPDAELGRALREALDGGSPEGFLAQLQLAVRHAGRNESSLDVLARWAPAGLIAAAAAALIFWMVLRPGGAGSDLSSQSIAAAPARMEIAPAQPEADVLLTSLLEGR
jgi:hypothetical protein